MALQGPREANVQKMSKCSNNVQPSQTMRRTGFREGLDSRHQGEQIMGPLELSLYHSVVYYRGV